MQPPKIVDQRHHPIHSALPTADTTAITVLDKITKSVQELLLSVDEKLLPGVILAGLIGFSFLLIIWKLSARKPSRMMIPKHCMASIIVDEKEGIREYNPEFQITLPCETEQEKYDLSLPLSHTIMKNLNEYPDLDLFGWHKTADEPFQWISMKQFSVQFTEFGSGLKHELGVEPSSQAKIGIYARNCPEWLVAHYGLLMYTNTAVPLYSTLGNEAMIHIVELTKMTSCVCFDEERAQNLMEIVTKASESGSPILNHLSSLVLMRIDSQKSYDELKIRYPKMRFLSMKEVQASGRKNGLIEPKLPGDEDLYIINFTSGTTSAPKGVLITCGNVKRVIESAFLTKPITRFLREGDVHFSFLPLAHILEQLALAFTLFMRAKAGFYAGDINKIMNEFALLKPTFLPLVPRLLIRIYDKTMEKMDHLHIPRAVINFAIRSKLNSIKSNGPYCETIWDKLFFNKIKQLLGGRVKIILTGSAACPPEVLDFGRAAFGAILYNGYGSTESSGPLAITWAQNLCPKHVGAPIEGVQIKLVDVPEMNLFPSRQPGYGRGEICARGVSLTKGYLDDPEKTKELIDSEGWMHTGDIGEWDEYGHLLIVDRCKNIFKLCQGEYIAPDKIENVYLTCPLVEQVFLDGRSAYSFAIAIVYPNIAAVKEHFSFTKNMTAQEICDSEKIRQEILNQMTQAGKAHKLASFEMAKKLHLMAEPMSIENGMLTSTLKTVRGTVRSHFSDKIDKMYATGL